MWPLIRNALLRPQTIVVLALLFLVTDALLAIFSPASAAAHPHTLQQVAGGSVSTQATAPTARR